MCEKDFDLPPGAPDGTYQSRDGKASVTVTTQPGTDKVALEFTIQDDANN